MIYTWNTTDTSEIHYMRYREIVCKYLFIIWFNLYTFFKCINVCVWRFFHSLFFHRLSTVTVRNVLCIFWWSLLCDNIMGFNNPKEHYHMLYIRASCWTRISAKLTHQSILEVAIQELSCSHSSMGWSSILLHVGQK